MYLVALKEVQKQSPDWKELYPNHLEKGQFKEWFNKRVVPLILQVNPNAIMGPLAGDLTTDLLIELGVNRIHHISTLFKKESAEDIQKILKQKDFNLEQHLLKNKALSVRQKVEGLLQFAFDKIPQAAFWLPAAAVGRLIGLVSPLIDKYLPPSVPPFMRVIINQHLKTLIPALWPIAKALKDRRVGTVLGLIEHAKAELTQLAERKPESLDALLEDVKGLILKL